MTHVILFHHAQGLTEGVAHAEAIGFDTIIERGERAADAMPERSVYAGFSLGTLPAQKLAQSRTGALGALLFHGGLPAAAFGSDWPEATRLQVHVAEGDEWVELDEAEQLAGEAAHAELFIYPGSAHLVADSTLAEYDEELAEIMIERSISFLDRLAP
jgi:dienelactone hydrolase